MNRRVKYQDKTGVACKDCMAGLVASLGGKVAYFVEWTDAPCTLPESTCASYHIGEHEHKSGGEGGESAPRFDRLPANGEMAKAIYRHFAGTHFKTLDVTRVFGQLGGDVMKMMRHHRLVKFDNCGRNTHYIHSF